MLVISCEMARHCRSDRFLMICIDLSWFLSPEFCCLEKSFVMCSGDVGDLFSKLGKSMNWRFHRQCSSSLTSSAPGFAAPCPSSYVLGWQDTRNSQNLYRIQEWNCLKLIVVLDINLCLHSIIILRIRYTICYVRYQSSIFKSMDKGIWINIIQKPCNELRSGR